MTVSRNRYLLGAVLLAAAAALPLFRQRGTPSWDTIWAEDGMVFFADALRDGPVAPVFRPYAGYMSLVPRLFGALSTVVPFPGLPLFLALAGTIVSALLAWFVYAASAEWIGSPIVRVALASMLVLMPAMGAENTANTTNLIWSFAAVLPWALLAASGGPIAVAVRSLIAFLAAASTALSAVFVPLAVGVVLVRRSRASLATALAFSIGLLLQTAVVVRAMQTNTVSLSHAGPGAWSALVTLFAVRVLAMFWIGNKAIAALWIDHGPALMLGAAAATAAVVAVLARGADRAHRVVAAVFLGYAILTFAIPVAGRGTLLLSMALANRYLETAHLRFSVVPVFFLASAVVLLADGPRGVARVARICFVAHLAVLTAVEFRVTNARSAAWPWRDVIADAERRCAAAGPDGTVAVRTDPLKVFPLWMTCRDLRRIAGSPGAGQTPRRPASS